MNILQVTPAKVRAGLVHTRCDNKPRLNLEPAKQPVLLEPSLTRLWLESLNTGYLALTTNRDRALSTRLQFHIDDRRRLHLTRATGIHVLGAPGPVLLIGEPTENRILIVNATHDRFVSTISYAIKRQVRNLAQATR